MRFQGVIAIVVSGIILSGCDFSMKKSGIEIISYPTAKVYLDGKESGMTPYKNNSLKPGEVIVKLKTDETEWTKKIHLENGANTVVNREFLKDASSSGGYILYFETTGDDKKAGLLVSSTPDRAAVAIDDEIKGVSPLRIENVGEGDKKLVISYPGNKIISSYVKFINGYQLVVDAELAKEEMVVIEKNISDNPASPSAVLEKMVTIKKTETGWLRVRSTADSGGNEVGRVTPGEKYKLLEEIDGWDKIDLGNNKTGWVSSKYVETAEVKSP